MAKGWILWGDNLRPLKAVHLPSPHLRRLGDWNLKFDLSKTYRINIYLTWIKYTSDLSWIYVDSICVGFFWNQCCRYVCSALKGSILDFLSDQLWFRSTLVVSMLDICSTNGRFMFDTCSIFVGFLFGVCLIYVGFVLDVRSIDVGCKSNIYQT